MEIKTKRIYEDTSADDGYRVLVDRIWPRGISKQKAALDEWNKDVAPSTAIRKAFNHKPENFATFKKQYIHELKEKNETAYFIENVKEQLKKQNVTLLYGAKSPLYNQAVILKEYLEEKINGSN